MIKIIKRRFFSWAIDKGFCGGIWPDWKIHKFASRGGIVDYNPNQLNPASYDLSTSNQYRRPYISRECAKSNWSEILHFEELALSPGDLFLLSSVERTILPPNVSCFLFSKSTTGRKGIEHLHAGFGECGFDGQWTFEVTNVFPDVRIIKPLDRLFQLVFISMASNPVKDYSMKESSHYKGQIGPTCPFEERK